QRLGVDDLEDDAVSAPVVGRVPQLPRGIHRERAVEEGGYEGTHALLVLPLQRRELAPRRDGEAAGVAGGRVVQRERLVAVPDAAVDGDHLHEPGAPAPARGEEGDVPG